MLDVIDKKIRRMHAALEDLGSDDLSTIKPEVSESNGSYYAEVDFNQDVDEIELTNKAFLLISNIASMKDHLKVWCKRKNIPFQGDALINSNQAVAIIHDLWNIDKHAELGNPPRSGHNPSLQGLQKNLVLSTGNAPNGGAFFSFDPFTGKIDMGTSGSGSVKTVITAQIVDEFGNVLGDFNEICSQAVEEWVKILKSAGVPII
jgi:hypothetical protein